MITKRDYLMAVGNGVLTGAFMLAILFFLNISFPFQIPVVLFSIPILWTFGVWLGNFLGKRIAPFFKQFGKFVAVGFSSASIDFTLLNSISYLTGITTGVTVGWINIPGFLVAVVNGYLWNKLWVFKGLETATFSDTKSSIFSDFPKFFGVTAIGLLINSGIIVLLTTYLHVPTLSTQIWLNMAKVIANAVALIWNFIGYKYLAFK